jgi:hypothetical protein
MADAPEGKLKAATNAGAAERMVRRDIFGDMASGSHDQRKAAPDTANSETATIRVERVFHLGSPFVD